MTSTSQHAKRLALALAGLLSCTTMAFSSTASAATTVYPGTICQPWGGHSAALQNFIEYSQFGMVFNDHATNRLGIVCPIPRNNNLASNPVNWVRVYYTDNHPGAGSAGQLACRLRSNSAFGDSGVDSQVRSVRAGTTFRGSWFFNQVDLGPGDPDGGVSSGFSDFNYTLFCRLPPTSNGRRSSIGTIIVNDN